LGIGEHPLEELAVVRRREADTGLGVDRALATRVPGLGPAHRAGCLPHHAILVGNQ
jgi:hypothetical protein